MIFSTLVRKFAGPAVVAAAMLAAPAASYAGVIISVGFAPPALPVYVQPVAPAEGYLWNPGYWAYGPGGYYWVPGVWVQPPTVGVLWTPPYWGFAGGVYGFHEGYWGPHVGFYGGVNYGFGYGGSGFYGGRWNGGVFAYNTAVLNVGVGFHSTYVDRTVIVNNNYSHTSFNGGPGGIQARPSAQEQQFAHENHIAPTPAQQSHFQAAASNKANFASANGGHPALAAVARPGATTGVPARGAAPAGAMNRPAAAENRAPNAGNPAARTNNVTGAARPAAAAEQARPAPEQARPAPQAARPAPQQRAAPKAESRPAPKEEHPHH
jgi:hypothetical protein